MFFSLVFFAISLPAGAINEILSKTTGAAKNSLDEEYKQLIYAALMTARWYVNSILKWAQTENTGKS